MEAGTSLDGYEHCDYFFFFKEEEGVRDAVEVELKYQNYWVDLTFPPPMNRVVEVANKYLNQDLYQPRDAILRGRSGKSQSRHKHLVDSDESSTDSSFESSSSYDDNESKSSNDERIPKRKSKGQRNGYSKEEHVPKSSKVKEKTAVKSPSIQDLAERFRLLELKLGEKGNNMDSLPPKVHSTMYCLMCGQQGHRLQDCSELKFFIVQGICRMNLNN